MSRRIAPSEGKAQEILELLQGQTAAESGEELLSALVLLSTERVLQEALEWEQTEVLGRRRYQRPITAWGYRNRYEEGTLGTAEGVLRVKLPQVRGQAEPYRSQLWAKVARTSNVLKSLVETLHRGQDQRPTAKPGTAHATATRLTYGY